MAKRVKRGFRMELRNGNGLAVAHEYGDKLRIDDSRPHTYDAVDLTAEACEALGITAALEDVPEPKTPGERLAEVLSLLGSHDLRELGVAELEVAAVALGIKPEGES